MYIVYKVGYSVYRLEGRLQCFQFIRLVAVHTVYKAGYSVCCL